MSAARCVGPSVAPSEFAGFRFPPEVITLAVRWYLRFGLSYRDVEELLAERGVEVDQLTPRSYTTASWAAHSVTGGAGLGVGVGRRGGWGSRR
jgi:hypothetical protein